MRCTVCGRVSLAARFSDNLRESGNCVLCHSTNRQRQLARLILSWVFPGLRGLGLDAVASLPTKIFNTEAAGPVHRALMPAPGYVCSEFMGPDCPPGSAIHGTRHEDLQSLSFTDSSFDIVISSDVLEHVADPYQAHREIFRILRPDGVHIFTVPFLASEALDEERSRVAGDGTVVHLLEAQYHTDPLRSGGALVFRLFGLEMLVRLAEIGFRTKLYDVRSPRSGIYGNNAFVFLAQKS